MESALGLSNELSSLIQKGLLWRGEGSSAVKHSALLPMERDHRPIARPFSNDTLTADTPPARQQRFLQHGLPLGAVHEWCVAQSSHETSSALKKRSTSTGVPPFSIITAILRSTLSHQLRDQSGANPSCAASTRSDPRLILWIGKNCWPTPHLLAQASHSEVNLLSRSLFIDPPDTKTKLWAIDAALRSPGVFGVVAQCTRLSTTMSRRFALAAAHGGTIGFIVRPEKELSLPSAAMSRWKVRPVPCQTNTYTAPLTNPFLSAPRWEVELLKCKGSFIPPATLPVRWFVEVCDEISLSFPAELVSGFNPAKATGEGAPQPLQQYTGT